MGVNENFRTQWTDGRLDDFGRRIDRMDERLGVAEDVGHANTAAVNSLNEANANARQARQFQRSSRIQQSALYIAGGSALVDLIFHLVHFP